MQTEIELFDTRSLPCFQGETFKSHGNELLESLIQSYDSRKSKPKKRPPNSADKLLNMRKTKTLPANFSSSQMPGSLKALFGQNHMSSDDIHNEQEDEATPRTSDESGSTTERKRRKEVKWRDEGG